MMTKAILQYIYVVCLISSLDLITQCQCSQSANSQIASEKPSYDVQESRKLSENIESITTYTNLLGDPKPIIVGDEITKDYQYYHEPIEITTPMYDQSPNNHQEVPNNHQPVHLMELDLNQSYFPKVEPIPYISTDTFIKPPPIQNTYVKVTREPFWAPEVYKLENQYIATFRNIKTSVMGFYYRMQDFVSYVMNLFTLGKFFINHTFAQSKEYPKLSFDLNG